MSEAPRFVVTGLGAVSACGWGVDALWDGLLSGRSATRHSRPLRRRRPPDRHVRRGDGAPRRGSPSATRAGPSCPWPSASPWRRSDEAIAPGARRSRRPGGGPAATRRSGSASSSAAAPPAWSRARTSSRAGAGKIPRRGPRAAPRAARRPADQRPRRDRRPHVGAAGPVETVSSACASGTQALGLALDALRSGEVEVAIVGGADSLCRLTYAGFNSLRVVDERPCRPFRAGRAGMNLGEGAGVAGARVREAGPERRGAASSAELLGVGNSCDAHHMTAPHPEGLGASLAVRRALADAGLPPDRSPSPSSTPTAPARRSTTSPSGGLSPRCSARERRAGAADRHQGIGGPPAGLLRGDRGGGHRSQPAPRAGAADPRRSGGRGRGESTRRPRAPGPG